MKRSTARNITPAITGFVTGFALVLLVGRAWIEDAHADIPYVTDSAIVDATGSRAAGWTLTFAGGEQWRTGSFRAELAACGKGKAHRKCRAIVKASMRDYVQLRQARRAIATNTAP